MNARLARWVALCAGTLLLAPAVASAAPTLTISGLSATVTGTSADENFDIVDHPSDADGTRFVGRGDSFNAWNSGATPLPAGCTQAVSGSVRNVDCTQNLVLVTVNLSTGNDRVSFGTDGVDLTFNGSTGNDILSSTSSVARQVTASGGSGSDSLTGAAASDEIDGGADNDTLNGGGGNDTLTGAAGIDTLNGGDGIDTLTGGTERGTLNGGNGNDTLTGGPSPDRLNGGAGNDTLDGAAARDILTPGTGTDDVVGGEGFDEVEYSAFAVTVRISPDDVANDGADGENDNVHGDVEDLRGGSGADVIVGNDLDNVIDGGGGADDLTGGGGFDTLIGSGGDDILRARDGNRESLDCGLGADTAVGDEIDELIDCETQDLSADLVADFDGDGFVKPADCNDNNGAIRPNAAEVPDNGVDENCDGVDGVNLDRDGDGINRPADCDDTNKAIRPGAREQVGNAFDEDCNGVAEPFPTILSPVQNDFTAFRAFTVVDVLRVRDVPAGALVRVTCKGRGCPKKGFSRTVRRATRLLDVRKPFKGRRLRVKARLEVRITKAGFIGRFVRYTVRRAALPKTDSLCLPPGKTKPVEC